MFDVSIPFLQTAGCHGNTLAVRGCEVTASQRGPSSSSASLAHVRTVCLCGAGSYIHLWPASPPHHPGEPPPGGGGAAQVSAMVPFAASAIVDTLQISSL